MEEQSKRTHVIGDPVVRNIKDETVLAKTGKRWEDWYTILDAWRAPEKDFTQIASHLRDTYAVSAWWSNIIASRYQWVRGLRNSSQR
jgi:hypothetical protein